MGSKKNKVLEFINSFKFQYKKELEIAFTNGLCYWFSFILKKEFDGEMYYEPVENHFVCKIDNKYYDMKGEWQPSEDIVSWSNYKRREELESKRIERQCKDLLD